jgi:hypothetical protein
VGAECMWKNWERYRLPILGMDRQEVDSSWVKIRQTSQCGSGTIGRMAWNTNTMMGNACASFS